ncbi:MAG: lamin tail domain-containing protein, partial [Deltaproteobacteria bacterium]|nr:lamin tail domain-containing protein [Deltaproteobacteria bacterium]
ASTAAVSPAVAYETSTLSCEPDTAVASCAFTVGWTVNGNASGTASTLSGTAFDKGDAVACSLTPSGGGTGTTSSPITIRDAPPSISGVSVTPTSTAIGGTFTCSYAGWSDPDPADATATVDYQWLLRTAGGDVAISGATAATIATTGLARGDQVVCRVTPRSGTTLGTPKTSAAVTVLNRAPTTPVVTVSAPDGAAGTVTCTLTTPATDDEPLTYTYAWSVNGTPIAATGPTLEAGVVFDCDLVRCQATASDGQAQATSAVASKAFPNGPDCDDGDTCNGAETCAAAGGCQSQTISGLLLHYDFERRISDQSGAGRDATASQTPLWGDGITGDAIRFDGSYTLTVSNAGALSPTTSRARTVSFWANVSTVGQHMAIGQYDNSTEAMFFVSISITDGYVRATGNGTDVVDAPLPSPYTGWHHWAFVFASGSDAVRIYRDGALVKTGTLALNANVSALAFLVGGASTGATFAGLMDELRIHDRALTDGEVQALGCSAATAELRINELDYDQPLSDVGEFLEIYNAGSTTVDLSAYRVQLINGDTPTNPTLYAAFDLQGQLPPGGYLVIAREALTGIAPDAHVLRFEDLFSVPLGGGALQNGPNDAVRIVTKVGGHRVDALIYESSAGLDPAMRVYGEGVPSSVAELDSDDPNRSIGRCPDGADTNDNATDFDRITPPTPGSENACGAAANEPFHAAARYDDDVERLVTTVALEVARIAVAGAATGAQRASVALGLWGGRAAATRPVDFTRAPGPDTMQTCFGSGSCP